MWINRDSRYELDIKNYTNQPTKHLHWHASGWQPPIRKNTFNSTTWRFKSIDTKNLFLFTFGEHLKDETLFKKE